MERNSSLPGRQSGRKPLVVRDDLLSVANILDATRLLCRRSNHEAKTIAAGKRVHGKSAVAIPVRRDGRISQDFP